MRALIFTTVLSSLAVFSANGWAQSPVLPQANTSSPIQIPEVVLPSITPQVAEPIQPVTQAPTAGSAAPESGVKAPDKAESKPSSETKGLVDSLHCDDNFGLKSLFDSLHQPGKSSHWYEKLSFRGYTQFRYGRTLYQDLAGADPILLGDRSINGNTENFSIRRARLILSGDVSDYLGVYFQPDFANVPSSTGTATFFSQLRDLYGDVYFNKDKVHRIRVGLSKVPFGFENMQSSMNRVPLDRTDPINTAVSPNERDLGAFYYWTPPEKQKLLKDLVDGGLKGSGNYGIFGLGVYDGQGGGQLEQNMNLHTVARFTWPWQLPDGQVVEASIQGYTGEVAVAGSAIRARGTGAAITPAGTGAGRGFRDQRLAGSFIWYPQPFGVQAEWCFGEGPGLNNAQTAVDVRSLHGGYVMAMYKHDTQCHGIVTPYVRYQYYEGGYRSIANAPFGTHDQWDLGVEWQIRKEMELVAEYSLVDGVNQTAINQAGVTSYRNFQGGVLRLQFQINY